MKQIKTCKYIILLAFLVFLTHFITRSQPIRVFASTDSSEILIGDELRLNIKAEFTPGIDVQWPLLTDTLGGFDIIGQSALDTTEINGKITWSQTLSLMAFDSGSYTIPPIPMLYGGTGISETSISSNPIPIMVHTIPVDTTQAFKPIKDIVSAPLTLKEIMGYVLIGGLVVALIGGLIWFIIKRRKQEPLIVPKAKPTLPPHEIAMRLLHKLEEKRLWQKGEIKAYYIELTDIIRGYIEGRFQVPALESVTYEIIRDLKDKEIKSKQLGDLRTLLEMADLAKFAKLKPSTDDNLKSMDTAREFVKFTKARPKPVVEETEKLETTTQ